MNPDNLETLIANGEDELTEFKLELSLCSAEQKAEFVKDLIALANAHGEDARYLLIGVHNHTREHRDVTPLRLDDNDLQQVAEAYIEPRVQFAYRQSRIGEVVLGVVQVEPSADRFHVTRKRLTAKQPDGKESVLLEPGQMWIRRGARRAHVTARDFERLRGDVLRRNQQAHVPRLYVCFADGAESAEIAANWVTLPGQMSGLASVFAGGWPGTDRRLDPPGTGGLELLVGNDGSHEARNIRVEVTLPIECEPLPGAGIPDLAAPRRPWRTSSVPASKKIIVMGDRLTHGLRHSSDAIFVVWPDADREYELPWTAHAGNQPQPTRGLLRVRVLPR